MRKQTGFTLIELVLVIVILGILAAFAIPRFIDIAGDARASTVKSMAGSLRSAAAMAKSMALAQGLLPDQPIRVDNANVDMIHHYPQGVDTGIRRMIADLTGFKELYEGQSATFIAENARYDAECQVTYTTATSADAPPAITINTNDC